ncbi:MAG: hypothetical protein NZ606_07360 [Candidatus Kapabacteria bacterium]|nr:hypothetical protein [Candidatus Kapabacteria bacterium]MCX7936218.1 hypothetical protein [Chlorobiota bacterium]
MRRWGIGKGYFRNALAVALLLLLSVTFVLLLGLRHRLAPLAIAPRNEPVAFEERLLVRTDEQPSTPTLGDWMVVAAIADSCLAVLYRYRSEKMHDSCAAAEEIVHRMEQRLAEELNRLGWNAGRFWYYCRLALAYRRDDAPLQAAWLLRCVAAGKAEAVQHSIVAGPPDPLVQQLLQGKTWWFALVARSAGEGRSPLSP